jgi:membrane protease YdiL (CAAX protease family)
MSILIAPASADSNNRTNLPSPAAISWGVSSFACSMGANRSLFRSVESAANASTMSSFPLKYPLSAPLDRFWQRAVFSWLPVWYVFSDVRQYAQFSRSVLIVVFSARLLLDGILGPVVEELYFRGYLLPRMSRLGWAAPLLNCALFALYHFWQPYNLPTLFFVSLPIVYGVWKTKNVRVGIYTHILLNTIGGISSLLAVLHR